MISKHSYTCQKSSWYSLEIKDQYCVVEDLKGEGRSLKDIAGQSICFSVECVCLQGQKLKEASPVRPIDTEYDDVSNGTFDGEHCYSG